MTGRSNDRRVRSTGLLAGLGLTAAFAAQLALASAGYAHGEEQHGNEAEAAPVVVSAEEVDAVLPVAFPVDIGGSFELVDHFGNARGSGDFEGAYPLIFFGYARCESICPVALRTMLEAVDLMAEDGRRIQPVLITIDPEGEPPEVLKPAVEDIHPRLLGLTGTKDQIAAVQKSFHVNSELVGTNIKGNKVFAHGSYVYLMDPKGDFLTLLPPILDAATMAEKLKGYLS